MAKFFACTLCGVCCLDENTEVCLNCKAPTALKLYLNGREMALGITIDEFIALVEASYEN